MEGEQDGAAESNACRSGMARHMVVAHGHLRVLVASGDDIHIEGSTAQEGIIVDGGAFSRHTSSGRARIGDEQQSNLSAARVHSRVVCAQGVI